MKGREGKKRVKIEGKEISGERKNKENIKKKMFK